MSRNNILLQKLKSSHLNFSPVTFVCIVSFCDGYCSDIFENNISTDERLYEKMSTEGTENCINIPSVTILTLRKTPPDFPRWESHCYNYNNLAIMFLYFLNFIQSYSVDSEARVWAQNLVPACNTGHGIGCLSQAPEYQT